MKGKEEREEYLMDGSMEGGREAGKGGGEARER